MTEQRFTIEYDQIGAFHGSQYPFKVYDIESDDWDKPVASFRNAGEAKDYVWERTHPEETI